MYIHSHPYSEHDSLRKYFLLIFSSVYHKINQHIYSYKTNSGNIVAEHNYGTMNIP